MDLRCCNCMHRRENVSCPALTYDGSTGAICKSMLFPTREPDAFTDC